MNEILEEAANLLEKDPKPLFKYNDNGVSGRLCIIVALGRANFDLNKRYSAMDSGMVVVAQHLGFTGSNPEDALKFLVDWNDKPERTKKDVIKVLREVSQTK